MINPAQRKLVLAYVLIPILFLALNAGHSSDQFSGAVSSRLPVLVGLGVLGLMASGSIFRLLRLDRMGGGISLPQRLSIALWGWLTLCSLSAGIYNGNLMTVIISLVQTFSWMCIFWTIGAFTRNRAEFRFLERTVWWMGIAITGSVYLGLILFYIFGFYFGEVVNQEETGLFRCFGPLGDHVGFIIVLFLGIAIAKRRYIEVACHFGAIILTGTRGAMISALIAGLWILFNSPGVRVKAIGKFMAFSAFGIVLVIWLSHSSDILGRTFFMRVLDSDAVNAGAVSRLDVFSAAVRVIMDNPLIGTGIGGFRSNWDSITSLAAFTSGIDVDRVTFYTQNQLLQFGVDSGIPGAILYIMFVLSMLRVSRRTVRFAFPEDRAALRGFDAFLMGIFLGNQSAVWFAANSSTGFFMMLVCGLILGYSDLIRQKEPAVSRGNEAARLRCCKETVYAHRPNQ